ncbi:MAG: Wzz/FepE/Etk N-terminal domain-containing protein [Bacteroidota bacterium]|nr:Wzz/FepE/Etk N-terminal domain-containing protein [Bacteroidota bacterium]
MENLNSLSIIKTIFKYWKMIFLVMIFAALISFAASFLIKEKYKSSAVVYPVNLFQNSEESPSEQLLQYFLSEDVKYKLAKDFKLFDRYGIDTVKSKGGKALFNYMFIENITVSPTIYESIEINVKDIDPAFAQKLNIALVNNTNTLIRESKKAIVGQYLANTKKVIAVQSRELDSISNSILKIKTEYDLIDADYQAKYLSKQISTGSSLNENGSKQVKGIKEKGSELRILNGRIESTLNSYTQIKVKNDAYLLDVSGDMDYYVYVSKPNLQDKKCSPVRWIIVMISSLSALLMTLAFIIYKNRSKEFI